LLGCKSITGLAPTLNSVTYSGHTLCRAPFLPRDKEFLLIFVGEPFVETGVEDLKELGGGLHILKSSA